MVYTLKVRYYSSEKRGMLQLRYPMDLTILSEEEAYLEYEAHNGRKCKMRFYTNDQGYLWSSVAVSDKSRISAKLHRLIYSNIYGEIPSGYEIDHIDRNRKNNLPDNLRLVTKSENNLNKNIKGEHNPFSKLTSEEVREILTLSLEHKMQRKEIARKFSVSEAAVKNIRAGKNWLWLTKPIFRSFGINK